MNLHQLEYNEYAVIRHWNNKIPEEYRENGQRLLNQLNIIKKWYKGEINILCGYTCDNLYSALNLNDLAYKTACAIDITGKDKKETKKLYKLINYLDNENKIEISDCMDEFDFEYIHLCISDDDKRNC